MTEIGGQLVFRMLLRLDDPEAGVNPELATVSLASGSGAA